MWLCYRFVKNGLWGSQSRFFVHIASEAKLIYSIIKWNCHLLPKNIRNQLKIAMHARILKNQLNSCSVKIYRLIRCQMVHINLNTTHWVLVIPPLQNNKYFSFANEKWILRQEFSSFSKFNCRSHHEIQSSRRRCGMFPQHEKPLHIWNIIFCGWD